MLIVLRVHAAKMLYIYIVHVHLYGYMHTLGLFNHSAILFTFTYMNYYIIMVIELYDMRIRI